MKEQISNNEWILLSSYLDGELAPSQKARVEKMLQTRPELARAYRSLTDTRAVLRSMPRRRAPRNFTLTQAMLPRPIKIPTIVPVLRLSSAVVAILAVVLFGYQLLPGASQAMNLAAAPKAADQTMNSEIASSMAAAATSAPAPGEEAPIITWNSSPATGLGGGGSGGGSDVAPDTRSLGQQPPEETPTQQPTAEASILSVAPEQPSGSGPILGIQPTESQGKELDQTYQNALPQVESNPVPRATQAPRITLLIYIAGALAVLAISLLVAATLIYRNAKR